MAGIEYYFNNLDHAMFQRLVNGILVARFGEDVRLTPLQGSDGGRDGETAPYNPHFEFQVNSVRVPQKGIQQPPRKGRYLFQVKYHRTMNTRPSDARKAVISEFDEELRKNVLSRQGEERINYFFLITNVPSSKRAITEIDRKAAEIRKNNQSLYVDIWWEERVKAFLDQLPSLWNSFPNLFAGGIVPFLAGITQQNNNGLPRAVRMAVDRQYLRDSSVKFRQIGLESNLSKLFVDLDITTRDLSAAEREELRAIYQLKREYLSDSPTTEYYPQDRYFYYNSSFSTINMLLDEASNYTRKVILEGGPGQGKSTITQMLTQIYRQQLLGKNDMNPEGRWTTPQKSRLPFRIELRKFAEWLTKELGESIEEYLCFIIKQDSGGNQITVDDIQSMVKASHILLIFDGLDEVASDDLKG